MLIFVVDEIINNKIYKIKSLIMAYSLFFLLESFKNPLPWGRIDSTG